MSADASALSSDRPEALGSVRVRAARAALEAALEAPGVLRSDPGPSGLRLTADSPSGPLVGVSATAQADGRYAVDLSLVANMVDLPELAEEVRDRVRKRARAEQLEGVLGAINVDFVYVVTAEEFAAAAAEQQVEETLAVEEPAATAALPEEPAEVPGPRSGTVEEAIAQSAAAQGRARPTPEGAQRLAVRSAKATPPGPDAAALAARQAALATDQAALAAKQGALAAEQAARAAEQAALAAGLGVTLPSLDSEGGDDDEERDG